MNQEIKEELFNSQPLPPMPQVQTWEYLKRRTRILIENLEKELIIERAVLESILKAHSEEQLNKSR